MRYPHFYYGLLLFLFLACDRNGQDHENTQMDSSIQPTTDASQSDANLYNDALNETDSADATSPKDIAYVRIHIISSTVDDLDAASIYTPEMIDEFFVHINETFAVANLHWEIESIQTHLAQNEQAYLDAVAAGVVGAQSLKQNVDPSEMLAPLGWDIFVVRQTYKLGFGGVYVCSVNGEEGMGTIFVPLLNNIGESQQKRKWSHEVGHATGLPHTPCEPEYADNLMMSGSCPEGNPERMSLNEQEILRILEQYTIGGPAKCGTIGLGDD